ncbi:MAG: (E)-4-hydroxy-3-methylbut-2-enyl-diphosphate synthase [Spirochaetaceae bacterium]|jgi:(E)-4-hydroxy-3-methylbut-2-enyl-diphosphate synthase|nr:(E)-4-hydroxy-3-methylbut-2-enyl-diphosphate synthase [Spirochaetaceae bacterium]
MGFNAHVVIGAAGVAMGKGLPVVIQTMWKDRLTGADVAGEGAKRTLARIEGLSDMGCRLLRFAVPDVESAEVLGKLAEKCAMPLVADIHFDYRIALRCLDFPIAKVRINPGNIGSRERVAAVLGKCAGNGVPVRIGVNGGSLSVDLRRRVDAREISKSEALCLSAERELAVFDELGFYNAVVSIKDSSVAETLAANRLFASRMQLPLHIGVTEAGPLIAGVARNAVALSSLLCEDLGDTVRVSLSDTMESEVIAAREILLAARDAGKGAKREGIAGVRIVSCPRCGRCGFDTHYWTAKWQDELYRLKKNISVAIMGCAVNGPGEARDADIGITGSGGKALIFKKGVIVRRIDAADADRAFREELQNVQ